MGREGSCAKDAKGGQQSETIGLNGQHTHVKIASCINLALRKAWAVEKVIGGHEARKGKQRYKAVHFGTTLSEVFKMRDRALKIAL
jgi:hypothetical protein